MSKIFPTLFTFLFVAVSFLGGQTLPVVYREDFTANNRTWMVGSSQVSAANITNGVYRVDRRGNYGYWYLPGPSTYLDLSSDYDIEVKMRWLSGTMANGYGIVFESANDRNINFVALSASGQYAAIRYENGGAAPLLAWTPNEAVKGGSEWNVLTLEKRGTAINIVVNGYTISSIVLPQRMGRSFGLVVNQVMSVEFDYIELRQDLPPIRLAPDHPKDTKRESLGPNVNCDGGDISPVITADGKRLYIGRYPYSGNIGRAETEDIWVSEVQKDGSWGAMANVGAPLNNYDSNFLISITPDLNTVIVGNTYFPDGRPRGPGISISHRTADGWEVPTPVTIRNYYNRHQFSEMCLGPSGTVLVMSVMRDDTRGDKDLYVSFKNTDGSFTEPRNMGNVNTWGREASPFIAADGLTMYFASDGRHGYGDMDIWMTRRLDDTWLNWTEPENLGPVVNSPNWDAYFTMPAKGDYAYISASNEKNDEDIYRIKLTPGVRAKPVVLVKGKVLDAKTKKPVAAFVEYESLTLNKKVGEARSAPKDGTYGISLPSGDLYGFRAEAPGYYPISDQLDTRSLNEYAEINRDLYLVPLAVNETILLNNLFFDFAQSNIRPESIAELDRLVVLLGERRTMSIELSGHTDNVGGTTDNQALSQARVNAVREYLVSKGVDASRMKAIGYGKKKPIAPNTTEEGRQRNRRVEFKIVKL